MIHSGQKFKPPENRAVELTVIVDVNGIVESARAVHGPEEFFRAAEGLEGRRRYKPFLNNGNAVRATFSDHIAIAPPEQWLESKVPFPNIIDSQGLRMHLERTPGWGGPFYSVDINGAGEVDFSGRGALANGHHHSLLSKQSVG